MDGASIKIRVELDESEVGTLHSGHVVKKHIVRNIVLVLSMKPLEEEKVIPNEKPKLSVVRKKVQKDGHTDA